MRIASTLAILSALVGADALAGSGSPTLAAGETLTIRTGVVYRDIKVCNDSASQVITWLAPRLRLFSVPRGARRS